MLGKYSWNRKQTTLGLKRPLFPMSGQRRGQLKEGACWRGWRDAMISEVILRFLWLSVSSYAFIHLKTLKYQSILITVYNIKGIFSTCFKDYQHVVRMHYWEKTIEMSNPMKQISQFNHRDWNLDWPTKEFKKLWMWYVEMLHWYFPLSDWIYRERLSYVTTTRCFPCH